MTQLDRATRAATAKLEQIAPEPHSSGVGFTMVGELIDNIRPPDWLIKGHMVSDSLALIYGPPKCGKSFLAIDWACSIATGTDWNGFRVKKAPVFYIAGEGHNGLAWRFKAWSLANGVDIKDASIAVTNTAAPLTDEVSATQVAVAVEDMAKQIGTAPALIVVDTLARNFGGDENSTQDMNKFVQHLDRIRQRWNATVLVVHHTGKDQSRGARGSVALRGAIDTSYSVDRDELKAVLVEGVDMKDAEVPAMRAFKLDPITFDLRDEDGAPVTSCVLKPMDADYKPAKRKATSAGKGKNQTVALDALKGLYTECERRQEGTGRPAIVDLESWKTATGLDRRRFSEVRRGLEESGQIKVDAPNVYLA